MMNIFCQYTCIFCDALTQRNLDLCLDCENDLPVLPNYCSRCAKLLPDGQMICGPCKTTTKFDLKTIVLFYYQTPIDQLIINLKFHHNLVNARILGELLANHLYQHYQNAIKPEVIIAVPLHPLRLRERGYNQALELAKPIAKKLNLPLDKFSVKRIKNTVAQTKLSAKKREQNIKHAFGVAQNFSYNHVAIVDDVITTGNTISELSKTLHASGVKKIDVWCLAKSHF